MYVEARRIKKNYGASDEKIINRLKCPKLLNSVEMSNANSQHKLIIVKYL